MSRSSVLWLLTSAATSVDGEEDKILPKGRAVGLKFTSSQAGVEGNVLHYLKSAATPKRDIYQFGVYTGRGLARIAHSVCGSSDRCGQVWGFDSFQGIPEDSAEEKENWRNPRGVPKKDFLSGGYSAANSLNIYNLSQLLGAVRRVVGWERNLTLVPGFFNNSLNGELLRRHTLQPALHVDMDADIYLSAFEPLDWMFAHGLIVPSTIVRYDDWPRVWATHGNARGTNLYGQARAHFELSRKYRVRWRPVGDRGSLQVLAIGDQHCGSALCSDKGIPDLRAASNTSEDSRAWRSLKGQLPLWGAPDDDGGARRWMGTTNLRAVARDCTMALSGPERKTYPKCALQRLDV